MKIIHSQGFSPEELANFRPAVLDNLLSSMKFVLHGMGILHIYLTSSKNQVHARSVLSCSHCLDETQMVLPWVSNALCCPWADAGVQAATGRGYKYGLNDSALYCKVTTAGSTAGENEDKNLLQTLWSLPSLPGSSGCSWKLWLLYGSAEALSSRMHAVSLRTWNGSSIPSSGRRQATCFMSDCAQVASLRLASGSRTWRFGEMRGQRMRLTGNRLQESMKLFSSVCNNVFFQSTSLILFLNKINLLQEKILHLGRHLRLSFPQYPGADCDVGAAARCITSLFLSCSETPQKLIYHHVSADTCRGIPRGDGHHRPGKPGGSRSAV
ncbi:unnamed protein product, partial [Lepidochelys olivacea]